jgi:uncharacterized protein YneR
MNIRAKFFVTAFFVFSSVANHTGRYNIGKCWCNRPANNMLSFSITDSYDETRTNIPVVTLKERETYCSCFSTESKWSWIIDRYVKISSKALVRSVKDNSVFENDDILYFVDYGGYVNTNDEISWGVIKKDRKRYKVPKDRLDPIFNSDFSHIYAMPSEISPIMIITKGKSPVLNNEKHINIIAELRTKLNIDSNLTYH